jgi:hypothetical protein
VTDGATADGATPAHGWGASRIVEACCRRPALVVGCVVAVVQGLAAVVLRSRPGPLYEDGWDYHHLAVRLIEAQTFGPPAAGRPPGWVFLLAAWYRITTPAPNAGLVLNAVLAGAAAASVVVLGRRLLGSSGWAAVAGLAYGCFPWTLLIGATLYSETLFNLLLVQLALLVDRSWTERPRPARAWLAVGALTGIGALVRPVMLFWAPCGVVFARWRGRGWRPVAAFALGLMVAIVPWTVRNYLRLGAVIPITSVGGKTLAVANNDVAGGGQSDAGLPTDVPDDELGRDRAYQRFALRWIREHPAEFASRAAQRIVRTFDPVTRLNKDVVGPPALRWSVRAVWVGLLAIVALGLRGRWRGRWVVPMSLTVTQVAPAALFGGGFRFLVPAFPFLAIWGAAGLRDLSARRPLSVVGPTEVGTAPPRRSG